MGLITITALLAAGYTIIEIMRHVEIQYYFDIYEIKDADALFEESLYDRSAWYTKTGSVEADNYDVGAYRPTEIDFDLDDWWAEGVTKSWFDSAFIEGLAWAWTNMKKYVGEYLDAKNLKPLYITLPSGLAFRLIDENGNIDDEEDFGIQETYLTESFLLGNYYAFGSRFKVYPNPNIIPGALTDFFAPANVRYAFDKFHQLRAAVRFRLADMRELKEGTDNWYYASDLAEPYGPFIKSVKQGLEFDPVRKYTYADGLRDAACITAWLTLASLLTSIGLNEAVQKAGKSMWTNVNNLKQWNFRRYVNSSLANIQKKLGIANEGFDVWGLVDDAFTEDDVYTGAPGIMQELEDVIGDWEVGDTLKEAFSEISVELDEFNVNIGDISSSISNVNDTVSVLGDVVSKIDLLLTNLDAIASDADQLIENSPSKAQIDSIIKILRGIRTTLGIKL